MALGLGLGLRHFVGEPDAPPRLDADRNEDLLLVQSSVSVALGDRPPEPPGTLYVTTEKVVWMDGKGKGYAVDFVDVSLHGISTDEEAYPVPCIYVQIETPDDDDEFGYSDLENDELHDLSTVSEMRLIPFDPSQLDALFNVFCKCAELNPVPHEELYEVNGWIFGAEQMAGDGDRDSKWNSYDWLGNPTGFSDSDQEMSLINHELQINDHQQLEDAEETEFETPVE